MLPWSDWVVPSPRRLGDEGEAASLHRSVSTTRTMLSKKTARMGDKAKPLAAYRRRLCCLSGHRDASIARRCDEGHSALPGLMLCCGRILSLRLHPYEETNEEAACGS